MKRIFVLVGMLVICLSLFAEGNPREPHTCNSYLQPPTTFVPDWFEYLEFADNNISDYNAEFLQEHGGRAGTIVFQVQDDRYPMINGRYFTGCSGTLIGKKYFITAGHCAVTNVERDFPTNDGTETITLDANIKNVGVLFGYQIADLYEDNDMTHPTYPRASLYGYLDENEIYRYYTTPSNFMEHSAYFPIIENNCNEDGSVEHGWGNVYWTDENGNTVIRSATGIGWPDDVTGQTLGETDYAIYELGINSNQKLPFEDYDPWPWDSDNNQLSTTPEEAWELPDNTNGYRGWAMLNTSILRSNSDINIIGFPGVATAFDGRTVLRGLKVVNAGHVVDGAAKARAHTYDEDILVFKDADIYFGNSGSSVIDSSGRLAGVVSWSGCFHRTNRDIMPPALPFAKNYATPIWKICRVSQIVKDAARDQDCNGLIDWQDLILYIKSKLTQFVNIGIGSHLIHNFEIPTTVEEIQIHKIDTDQKKVVTETKEIPAYTYQVAFQNNGNLFYIAKQNNTFYLFKNGTSQGEISGYPEMSGSAALVKGDDIYFAGGNLSIPTPMLPGSGNNSFQPYITKISSDGQNGYNFSVVATFPENLEDISIFELGNDIYLSGNTATNFVVYKQTCNR